MEKQLPPTSQSLASHAFYKVSSPENRKLFISWSAGLIGGFTSATICAPMDIARTRHILQGTAKQHGSVPYQGFIQTMRRICREEGFKGLFKGYSVTAVSVPAFHSLYFTLFYRTKESLDKLEMFKERNIVRDLAASSFAGIICNTLTNPLWVVRTRIQSQYLHPERLANYKGLVSGINRVYREEGFKALFKGLGASYLGLSHAIILYPLYEHLKGSLKEYKGSLNSGDIFMTSLIAKVTAMVVTYPHLVLRARLQDNRREKATLRSVIRQTIQNEGFKGLYAGLRIDMVRVLPSNSIMFVMFEFVKQNLEKRLLEEERDF